MYLFIIIVHVIVCLILILVVLLQAGRGGGMTDMLGSQAQNVFGTQTNEFMVKATEISAVLFIVTSLSLGIISTQRGKSLIERRRFGDTLKRVAATQTALPGKTTSTAPAETKPAAPVAAALETKEAKAV